MRKKNIDELIEESMGDAPPMKEIDIRKETMARITAYVKKKSKHRRVIHWILSAFTAITSLGSVYVLEIIFNQFWLLFLKYNLNYQTFKIVFQGFFLLVLVAAVIITIINQKYREQLYNSV